MRSKAAFIATLALSLSTLALAQSKPTANLNYADFESGCQQDDCHSTRGGYVTPASWQEQADKASFIQPVFVDADSGGSKRMAYNYKLLAPQQYAGVALTIGGLPAGSDGKPQAEDLSVYKELSFDMEAAGPHHVRVQFLSEKSDVTVNPGFEPFCEVDVQPGMQNYRCPIKKIDTPTGAPASNSPAKAILKKVTSLQFVVNELGSSGHVVLDNITFVK